MGKKAENNQLYSASQAAKALGISVATIKNWAKLGKLPCASNSPLQFSKSEITSMAERLDDLGYLQSRRNKSHQSTNYIPKSYISSQSPNYPVIRALLSELSEKDISLWEVISYYAGLFFRAKDIPAPISADLLGKLSVDADSKLSDYPLSYIEGEDTLGMLYISLRRLQEKKSTGSYYTPFFVVDRIIEDALSDIYAKGKSVLDPSCGTGNFLLRLPKTVALSSIYGRDIDETAISIARINMVLKFDVKTSAQLKTIKENIKVQDYLSSNDSKSFDFIIGNPPWGYDFSRDTYTILQENYRSYSGSKKPESFSLFIEKSLKNLTNKGVLSFLLPEAILDVRTHASIRAFILEESELSSISYLGDVFDKVQCPCVILSLKKSNAGNTNSMSDISFYKADKGTLSLRDRFKASNIRLSQKSFQLLCGEKDYTLIKKIEAVPHFTLRGNATFALGIVTGSNKTMILTRKEPDYEPIVKGKDIEKFHIKEATGFLKFTPTEFQQCAPEEAFRADQKLFYRFIADEPVVALDNKGMLSLNSANIIIPHVEGYSPLYIMAILNSDVISFYYRKRFRNMKVLRSALEELPIPICSEKDRQTIEKLALEKDYTSLNKKVKELFTFPV